MNDMAPIVQNTLLGHINYCTGFTQKGVSERTRMEMHHFLNARFNEIVGEIQLALK